MPVAAVAGAVFAGAQIATVGIAAMTAFEVVAAVGAIASGIGAITGNEKLMKIGGIAALAGGVGMFAQGKGWLPSGESGGASNIETMTKSATPGVDTGLASAEMPMADAGGAMDIDMGTTPQSGSTTGTSTLQQNITAPASETPNMTQSGSQSPGLANAEKNFMPSTGAQEPVSNFMPGAEKSGSVFDSIGQFGKNLFTNKDGSLNKDLLSMAGNFVGGMFDDKKKAETDYLNSRNDELQMQMKNASAIPDISGMKLRNKNIFPGTAPTYRPTGLSTAKA
jgi:hypothetical protein